MPKTMPQVKVSQTASHGAEILLFGEKFDDASAHARQLEKERGLTFVHPFDHPHIAAGQGTVALEMIEDVPELRSEEHTSELQSLMRISYAVLCLKKKTKRYNTIQHTYHTYHNMSTHKT